MLFLSRNVVAESDDVIKAAVDGLNKNGFINYYGLQVKETYTFFPSQVHSIFSFCVIGISSFLLVIPS
jgi:hypothetical protein